VSRQEKELSAKADLILAASPAIAGKFPAAKTVVLLHGVDVKKFSNANTPRATDLPAHPAVAGFYGLLSDWMDTELLAYVAAKLPQWRLVLVGQEQTELAPLKKLPNVVMMGPRRHDELPSYVRHWDVSLLPFRRGLHMSGANPLKLREYLAAGTPIVSTDFPALDGYRDLVEVAATPDAFVAAMLRAREEGRRREQDRLRRVAAETWEARARQVSDLIGQIGARQATGDPTLAQP
jgi:glycosyltransferase involved in cell wall biosynthesis